MSTETTTEPEIDTTFPAQESNDAQGEILHAGKPQKRSSFADSLKDAKPAVKADEPEAKVESTPKEEGKVADPIADKIAAESTDKKDKSTDDKPGSLLDAALKKKTAEKEAAKEEKKEAKPAAKEDEPAAVTDADIEDELKSPHRSLKTQNRIKALHKQWKDADAKVATTAKALAEKDAKLQDLEKKLSEAGKAAGVAPEVQAQLDELQQYRRQYEVENSPRYKEFNDAYEATEGHILSTLKNAGVKFKGQTWEQTEAYIKEVGGYSAFQKKHPELARNIREDVLGVAESDEISASISRQKLLEEAKKNFVSGEKKQAKEYFSKKEAEAKAAAEAAAANAPKPEAEKQARKAKLEQWREQTFAEVELFKDEPIPAEASDDTRASVKKNNELKAFLRANLAANLNLDKEEDIARVALDATLAHFFKKAGDGLAAENDQLRAEIKKLKSAGKTIVKGSQPSAPAANEKPPKTFEEALSRVEAAK
jgi:hypothetical protein